MVKVSIVLNLYVMIVFCFFFGGLIRELTHNNNKKLVIKQFGSKKPIFKTTKQDIKQK